MKALIFAAGLGTRLRPLTDSLPKALVPVCGQPLLWHIIGKLREAGYRDVVVNVHHFPEKIREYLQSRDFGVKIRISDESDHLLETGGGIVHARDLLLPADEPFLVHNVDIISDLDLAWVRSRTRADALATLVVSPRQSRRKLLFDERMRLMGWMDCQSGEVRSPYPQLKAEACRQYAFAGVHNLSPRIFPHFAEWGFTGRFPIMDFYLKTCATEPIYGLVAEDLSLVDVGKYDMLSQAQQQCEKILKP